VLEALGLHVSLVRGRKCCGRPAFSQGNLDLAAKLGHYNVSQLSTNASPARTNSQLPIVFLEPSCYSMFAEDYRELKIPALNPLRNAVFSSKNLSMTSSNASQSGHDFGSTKNR
jgi:Fe-S oxidoreductase